ncbi:MAG: AAA family ATPase [Candidatus Thorarchaeota archaeon]|nr:AAA family ATPase [Candidatus Thorarchaeota archaeon]MCK5239358.1 AAA family ATPase [Candidatus Thorarchaeota archaeon]
MRERLVFSVSGKGGVGKTTTSALLSRVFAEKTARSMLLVDADPVMNLPRVMGVEIPASVGDIATQMRKSIDDGTLPASAAKQDILEGDIFESLVEGDRYDFLAMGRTEGEGCYCYVNRLLTQILDRLSSNYEITLLDMSAGLEHFSRRTNRNVDILIIVIDSSRAAFEAALRIRDLAKEVHIDFKKLVVIGNRIPDNLVDAVSQGLEENGLYLAGMIPNDDEVAKLNYLGKPVFELPDDSPALKAVEAIAENLGLLSEATMLKLLGQ